MADYVSVQKVRDSMGFTLGESTSEVKEGYDLWMNVAVDLPQHMLPPAAVKANDLIHAALRTAPRGSKPSAHEKLNWLFQHLPGISTAMHDALSSQLDISAKRISALQPPNQDIVDRQPSAQLLAERDTHVLLEIQLWAYLCTQPMAVLATVLLSEHISGMVIGGRARRQTRRQRLQRDMLLGEELCEFVGRVLHSAGQKAIPLRKQNLQNKANLHAMNVWSICPSTDEGHLSAWVNAHRVGLQASCSLCGLAGSIPSTFLGGSLIKQVLALAAFAFEITEYESQSTTTFRSLVCKILAEAELRSAVAALFQGEPGQSALSLASLLRVFGIRAEHLREVGIPDAKHQRVLADLGGSKDTLDWPASPDEELVGVPDRPNSETNTSTQNHGGGADGVLGALDGNKGGAGEAAGDGVGGGGGVGGEDVLEDADDMHALLQLMYGCNVSKGA